MAEEKQHTYPDIPINQWWKLRGVFRNRLVQNISLKYLQDALGAEIRTARGVHRNLQLFGFVDKEGNTTERANHWRIDDQYAQVCKDIMADIYPVGLLDAPVETVDRNYLVNWFVRNTRVGENYAAKNAAVFELLREADPTKAKDGKTSGTVTTKTQPRKSKQIQRTQVLTAKNDQSISSTVAIQPPTEVKLEKPTLPDHFIAPTVHIDIQLHIAPDAPASQIEEIFASIERHLYKK